MRHISKIIIHCAATRPSSDIGAAEIRRWHIEGNGWSDIGYHGVIRRDGTLESGRPMDQAGAHTSGQNKDSIGLCLAGGVKEDGKTPENNFTPEQWKTLERVVKELVKRFPGVTVHGHNEFANKACPCFDAKAWWAKVSGGGRP